MSSRLAQLLALRDKVDEAIAVERRRMVRVADARDRIESASNHVLDAIPARRVRDWARRKGIPYPTTGRVPRTLRAKYLEDTTRQGVAS